MSAMAAKTKNQWPLFEGKRQRFLFVPLILTLYLAEYCFLFFGFLWKYVDSDQLITADMAYFYSQGYVPEPFFWGQRYLFPIESWLAQPFVLFGMRADLATIFVSAILFYSAFFLLGHHLKTRNFFIKFLYFSIPLVLPTKFLLVSLMPRTFGAASAVGCIAVVCYLNSTSRFGRYISVAALGIACGSYSAIFLFVPLILLKYGKRVRLEACLVFILSFGLISLLTLFYVVNPQANVYRAPSSSISLSQLQNSLQHLNIIGVPAVLLFMSIAVASLAIREIRLDKQTLFVGGAVLAIALIFLSSERITSFQDSVFFSAYRFWVAIPGVILIFFSSSAMPEHSNRLTQFGDGMTSARKLLFIFALGTLLLIPKISWVANNSTKEAQKSSYTGVAVRSIVRDKCSTLRNQIRHDEEYLVTNYGENFFYIYGCYFLDEIFIKGIEGDRRWWYEDFVNKRGLTPVP